MVTRLHSAAVAGIEGFEVQVEVDLRPVEENARISIVGLPDTAVRESVQRVSSALANSGFYNPGNLLVTVNLAPADVRKSGPGFDLPIAIGLGIAVQQNVDNMPDAFRRRLPDGLDAWCLIGELALDGMLRAVRGVLPLVVAAREAGRRRVMVPCENAAEAAMVEGVELYPVRNLREAWDVLLEPARCQPDLPTATNGPEAWDGPDFCDVKGQPYARRAMEIAAAGGHNLLMCGSPGSGKSMLAERLPGILPPLSQQEALVSTAIHSVCNLLPEGRGLLRARPYRAPHHTISDVGLMGGGSALMPGEVSLAHNGVLFLDELPEFARRSLETLRQPLESGRVTISRASGTVDFPCSFMLVAAMNPCPCGYLGDPRHRCKCRPAEVQRYRHRISGPLLDRFDLLVEVPPVNPAALLEKPQGESSSAIRARVVAARERQRQRYEGTGITCNARLSGQLLRRYCPLTPQQGELLLRAVEQFGLSARAFDRILRVARTIADLAGLDTPGDNELYEAIQFRQFEQQLRS